MGRPVVHFKIDVQGWSRTEERDISSVAVHMKS